MAVRMGLPGHCDPGRRYAGEPHHGAEPGQCTLNARGQGGNTGEATGEGRGVARGARGRPRGAIAAEDTGEVAVTRGTTFDNRPNLPGRFVAAIEPHARHL